MRDDEFGGQELEDRLRWPLRLTSLVRKAWADKPLFVRISASDWAQELGPEKSADGKWNWWGIEQSVILAGELEKLDVNLIDVSSGGNYVKQKIDVKPGYQASEAQVTLVSTLIKHEMSVTGALRRGYQKGSPQTAGRVRGHDY